MGWTKPEQIPSTAAFFSTALVNLGIDSRLLFVHRGKWGVDDSLWYQLYHGKKWQGDKQLPKHYSADGAALVMLKGSCYCVHRGGQNDDKLYMAQFVLEGERWTADQALPDVRSSRNPAAVAFDVNGVPNIIVVHRGWKPDEQLYWTRWDGHGWTKTVPLGNHHSSDDPALAVYEVDKVKKVYCLHRGGGTDDNIYMTTFDGATWSADVKLPDHHTGFAFAKDGAGVVGAAEYKGRLHLLHKGKQGDNAIWHAHYNGATWSTDSKLTEHQGSGISLATLDGVLHMVHLDRNDVYYSQYTE
jgi:hypothetical protein